MLFIKRALFRFVPNLGIEFAKLTSRPRRFELRVVEAVVPQGALAIDIGASWGLYTVLLRQCTNTVAAFEPHPEKARYLTSVFRKKNVKVHSVALSDQQGETDLIVPHASSAFATIEPNNPLSETTGSTARIRVPLRTLNDFGFQNVGFIKIDVEGHEFSVLSGACKILLRDKPILYVRLERRHNPTGFERTVGLLAALGYRGFFWDAQLIVDLRSFNIDRDQPLDNAKGSRIKGRYIYCFLFLPATAIETTFIALKQAGFDVKLISNQTA